VTNATIADNSAGPGGTVDELELEGKGPPGAGSGIDVAGGPLTEANTIVSADDCAGPVANGGHDLQFGGAGCPGLNGNPELGPLQNNGGPTETMAPGATSFAIGQIPAAGSVCPALDQRGDARPDSSETACEIGAYEVQDAAFVACSTCRGLLAGATLGPETFRLRLHATETNRVTIVTALRRPRTLLLQVRKHAGTRLVLIGYAHLGEHPGGRSTLSWNLRVGGKLLPHGAYQLMLYGLDNGNVLSLPAAPGSRTLVVLPDGKVRT
jgi:hypothetical protein